MFSPDDFLFLQMTPEQTEEYFKQLSTPAMKRLSIISFLGLVGAIIFMVIKFN